LYAAGLAVEASPDQHAADSRSAIVGLVEQWLAAVVDGRIDAFDDLYDGDATGIKARGRAVRDALADLTGTVDQIVVEGCNVAWRFTLSGTHVGELAGHAATHRHVSIRGVNFLLIREGRVASTGRPSTWQALSHQANGAVSAAAHSRLLSTSEASRSFAKA
jgi:predicted ester cyclase